MSIRQATSSQVLMAFVFASVISIIIMSCGDGKQAQSQINYPPDQRQFHQLNAVYPTRYEQAPNQIQKSAVFNECNSRRRGYYNKLQEGTFAEWIGEIESIGTDQGGGTAYLTIRSRAADFGVTYKTYNNSFSDSDDHTMLRKGSEVYNQAGELQEGSWVLFSGRFLPDKNRGMKEASLTELGCVDEPEFIIQFTKLKPLVP
ncbi:hypothetical protein IT157_07170 [bacterium]|nr:hypothetical protein [bacterium]